MPSFNDLIDAPHRETMTSLAYWIGNIKTEAPLSNVNASHLSDIMSMQYDMEGQSFGDEYGEMDDFTDKYFLPVAPVTLTRSWCPLDTAQEWLGVPAWQSIGDSSSWLRPAAASWTGVDSEKLEDVKAELEDMAHFRFLLSLTLERALDTNTGVLIVCCPGWSFEHAQENPMADFGYSSLSAGRLYPERVPSGRIGIEQVAASDR